MACTGPTHKQLLQENAELRRRLEAAEEALHTLREVEVAAVIVSGSTGDRLYALNDTPDLYRVMVETMSEAGLATSPDGILVFCNDHACTVLQRPLNQLLGHALREFVSPQDAERLSALLRSAQTQTTHDRILFVAAGGAIVPLQISANYLSNADAPLICLVATDLSRLEASHDLIQQFQEQQQALAQREREYALLVQNMPGLVFRIDRQHRILFIDGTIEPLTGWKREQLLTKLRGKLSVLTSTYEQSEDLYDEVFATGLPRSMEWKLGDKWLDSRLVPEWAPDGSVATVLGIAVDISARKEAEDRLRKNQMLLHTILDNLPIGVWTLDKFGHIMQYNPAAQRIWGVTQQLNITQFKDRLAWRVNTGQRLEADDWASTRAITQCETTLDEEIEIQALDGTRKIILNSAIPIYDTHQAIGAVVTNQDITDRKRAEREIQGLNARLEQRAVQLEAANKELESFSYAISHDLRSPLRSIDGFSLALLEDYGDRFDDTGRDYLQRMRRGAQHMANLIDALLSLSHMMRAGLRRAPVELSAVARSIAHDLRSRAPERRVEFVIADTPVVIGDSQLLHTLLTNLLDNAWKFTARCDQTRIEFGALPCGALPAAADAANSGPAPAGPIYFVRDNGAGFDMAYAGKLFGAFQRLHAVTEYPGIGIGLATVLRIVRRHGGRVWAEGAVDQGATFYFTFKDSTDRPAHVVPGRSAVSGGQSLFAVESIKLAGEIT
jgi:PAS domain S-box-containing protein